MDPIRQKPGYVCMVDPPRDIVDVAVAADWYALELSEQPDIFDVALVFVSAESNVTSLRHEFPLSMVVAVEGPCDGADFELVEDQTTAVFPKILKAAEKLWRQGRKVQQLAEDLGLRRQRMHQLSQISLALTEPMAQHELLQTLLLEARRIGACEGASLFLIERDAQETPSLVFKLAQNDVVEFPFVETRLPLDAGSIAGYVACSGTDLNIRDVYKLSEKLSYSFNRSFDNSNGYRTRSVLAIAMRDHRDQVVGVLQFINRRDPVVGEVVEFDAEVTEVLRAIASQAAVSIQKNALLEDINQLFESFVQASVKTIEQRDPSTSGHSFRVAQTTVSLLEALPLSGLPEFRNLDLSAEHIREVRYAALLHDFGKVGVPEAILVKANKLSDDRMETLHYRFELQKERLRRKAIEQEIGLLHQGDLDIEVARRRVHRQLEKQLSLLDQYFEWVVQANDPTVVAHGDFGHLTDVRNYEFPEFDGSVGGVINDNDLLALSVRKGSLTPEERRAIQSHVVYTKEFLETLPWPPELLNVPEIAGAHHERVDGSGYPLGLVGEQIPLASRVMAVCDIYDALTAMDRAYKPAMSQQTAFRILHDEASRGLLDVAMVNIFIDSGSFQIAKAG